MGTTAKLTGAGLAALALAATTAAASEHGSPRAAGRLVERQAVAHLGLSGREPALLVTPKGQLFVAGYGHDDDGEVQTESRIWRSDDGGAHWTRLKTGANAQGVIGDSDTSLALGPDGTIYFASLYFDRKRGDKRTGDQFSIGVSHDGGASWTWTNLSKNARDDRGWVATAPDGSAHVVWDDGDHIFHAMSSDGGRSWSKPAVIHAGGGSSHIAIGPNGHIVVRVIPVAAANQVYTPGADLLLVSADNGRTWSARPVPGVRQWSAADASVPRWVEPVAFDAKGALYLLWTQADGLHLGRSRDEGLHWDSWMLQPTQDDDLMYYPFLIARGDGELAASWYRGGGDAVRWQAATFRVGKSIDGLHLSAPALADAWDAPAAETYPRVRSSAGEYTGLAWATGGGIAVVTPIQDGERQRFGFTWRRLVQEAPKAERTIRRP